MRFGLIWFAVAMLVVAAFCMGWIAHRELEQRHEPTTARARLDSKLETARPAIESKFATKLATLPEIKQAKVLVSSLGGIPDETSKMTIEIRPQSEKVTAKLAKLIRGLTAQRFRGLLERNISIVDARSGIIH